MTWGGALTAFETALTTAAAVPSPAVAIVRRGEPDTVSDDTIAYFPTGWRDSRTGGETFTKKSIERAITVVIYLRASARSGAVDPTLEDRLVAVEEAVIAALMLDRGLGGNAIGLYIDGGDYGWVDLAGQLCRTSTLAAWVDLPEVFPHTL